MGAIVPDGVTAYDERFFEAQRSGAHASAEVVVPLLLDLVGPTSIVDVGCGTGAWLAVFREQGVDDVVGVDGAYVPTGLLAIPAERFVAADLSAPLELGRRFDLALSLEVAEHLPEAVAGAFVRSLTRLADVVVFSAAVPGQLGEGHVNEQWQDWWSARFAAEGFVPVDAIRRHVWNDPRVAWWYAQNVLLFVAERTLGEHPRLLRERELIGDGQLRLVHPRFLEWREHVRFGRRLRRALRLG